jgi:hypothetical protein
LPLTLGFLLLFSGILVSFNSLNIFQLPRINSAYNFIEIFSIRF